MLSSKQGTRFTPATFPAGEELLAKVQEKDPQMYIVPFMLGEGAARQQKWEEASAAFQKCLQLNPNFDQAMTGLARRCLSIWDKPDEAVAVVAKCAEGESGELSGLVSTGPHRVKD